MMTQIQIWKIRNFFHSEHGILKHNYFFKSKLNFLGKSVLSVRPV